MPLLAIDTVCAGYGPIRALHGISLSIDEGEIVTLIGANGAGKSTTLRAISRLIPTQSGSITYREKNILRYPPHEVARMGIAHVPEGRGIFGNLTVEENLRLSLFANRTASAASRLFSEVFERFPVLGQRRRQLAATLSGGEQQMLAIGRAVIADADLFILDEPSMGLSPVYVKNVFSIIAEVHKKGKTILLIEQNATMALRFAQRAYILENGRIVAQGTSKDIACNEELKRAYLG